MRRPALRLPLGLEKARALLAELGAPEPDLPPFDPANFEPMPDVELAPPDDPIEESPQR